MVRFPPTLGPALCLAALVAIVFGFAATAPFVQWDDPDMVVNNPRLNPPTWQKTAELWRQPVQKMYTPLAYTVWAGVAAMENYRRTAVNDIFPPVAWLSPGPFHLLNLVLHAAAGISVYFLLRLLLENNAAALVGAMVFLVHPLQAESVAWVAGMNGVLAGALAMAALWQYVAWAKTGRRRALAIATALFAAALLSKPTTVVVPAIVAVLDALVLRRPVKVWVTPVLVWAAMAVGMAVVAEKAQPATHLDAPRIGGRFLVAADAVGFYAKKLVAPVGLTIDYGRSPAWLLSHPMAAWPGIAMVALAGIVVLMFWRRRWPAAVIVIFLVALAPVLGFVPFEFQAYSTVADRYMYLPMFAVALLAGHVMRWTPWWAAAVVLAVLAGRALDQTRVWHDTPALAEHQLAIDPNSATGHKIYAAWLEDHGHPDAAEAHYRAAIAAMQGKVGGNEGIVRYDLGNILLREQRYSDAARQFTQALPLLPPERLPMAHNNLGEAKYFLGDKNEARREFEAALRLQPDFAPARRNVRLLDRN